MYCRNNFLTTQRNFDTPPNLLRSRNQTSHTFILSPQLLDSRKFGNHFLVQAAPVTVGAVLKKSMHFIGEASYR